MLYADPLDKKLYPILESAINNYKGPVLNEKIIPQRIHGELKLNTETGLAF